MRQIIVGTHGSTLALAQTRWVVARLKEEWPDSEFRIQTIVSQQDGDSSKQDDCFSNDLEKALLEKKIDIAVYDLKDFSLKISESLELASIPKRIDARDALIGRMGMKNMGTLPVGATLGVSTPRQQAFLAAWRPDLVLKECHGNIESRLSALGNGEFDAIVVAASDLIRIELRNRIDELIDPSILLPAPGQGALGLQTRAEDDIAIEVAYSLNDRDTDDRVTAERAFMEGLSSYPYTIVGSLATLKDGFLKLEGWIASPNGSRLLQGTIEGEAQECEDLGLELAQDIVKQGEKSAFFGLG